MTDLRSTLNELETAEDFFEFFHIPYDQRVVDRCRLHILQRAHDYLALADSETTSDDELRTRFRAMLEQAYRDFTTSDPLTERVFKVLRDAPAHQEEPRTPFVPLDAVFRSPSSVRSKS